jgi:CheY-like chemotaxis protein
MCIATISLKILLADDDEDDRELFQHVLGQNEEFSLQASVENGRDALTFLNGISDIDLPDIILLDQNMPKLNGLETLKALRANERYNQVTVVIYSTFTDSRLMEQYRLNGAAAVFIKPSKIDEYNAMLGQITELIKQTVQ